MANQQESPKQQKNQTPTSDPTNNLDPIDFSVRILRGFLAGILVGILPVIIVIWFFSIPASANLKAAISSIGSPTFDLFWIGAGLITALLLTGIFAFISNFRGSYFTSQSSQQRMEEIPATGKDHKHDEHDPSEK
jgi:hypothetical protein